MVLCYLVNGQPVQAQRLTSGVILDDILTYTCIGIHTFYTCQDKLWKMSAGVKNKAEKGCLHFQKHNSSFHINHLERLAGHW